MEVPLIFQAGQLFKIGPQILQFAVAGKYWAEGPKRPGRLGLAPAVDAAVPKMMAGNAHAIRFSLDRGRVLEPLPFSAGCDP
jgi:hypothetical protein